MPATNVRTADASHATTTVAYPAGSTRVEAVAYDGTRIVVYGE
jgi:hypothetical protein